MNTELRDLYQQMIIDHSNNPRNYYIMEKPKYSKNGYNSLCGDKVILYIKEEKMIITDVCFTGSGCAISTASASLMTTIIKNMEIKDILILIEEFQKMLISGNKDISNKLGKLTVFSGVSEFPMRVKCATLPWHTLRSLIYDNFHEFTNK